MNQLRSISCDRSWIVDDALMPYRVTAVDPTPNPNAMKFMLDRPISVDSESFLDSSAANENELAKALFAIDGVAGLLFLGDFVTVNKTPAGAWKQITPRVKKVLGDAP
ncbi:MAG: NifU N-terminal domain-containing protein [Phycisphaerae bacterium]|nr:NifU N-terminal domain-containing protein [Phycisphaerae bacterium]